MANKKTRKNKSLPRDLPAPKRTSRAIGVSAAASKLRKRMEHQPGYADRRIVHNPPGELKMSAVLEDFIEPYVQEVENLESYRKLITLAVVGWNISLYPKEMREEPMLSLLETMPTELQADARSIVGAFIDRKERHFAHIRRMILDFELTDLGDGVHLTVTSTPEGELPDPETSAVDD